MLGMVTRGTKAFFHARLLAAAVATVCLGSGLAAQQGGIEVFTAETLFASGTRVSLTHIYASSGTLFRGSDDVADPLDREFDEHRTVVGVDHGLSPDLAVSVLIPWVSRSLESNGSDPDGSGIGDVALLAKRRIYKRDWKQSAFFLSGIAGVELPTGDTGEREAASRLPPELQPGAGAWNPFVALSSTLSLGRWRFDGQAFYKFNMEGTQDFEFGDFLAVSVDGAYRFLHTKYPGPTASARLGLQYRHQGRAQLNDVRLTDTGSDEVRARAGLTWHPAPNWDITFAVELPIHQDFHGEQLGLDVRTFAAIGLRF